MSIRLKAHQTVTYLPNPEFGDSEALLDEVQKKRAIDGTLYTLSLIHISEPTRPY